MLNRLECTELLTRIGEKKQEVDEVMKEMNTNMEEITENKKAKTKEYKTLLKFVFKWFVIIINSKKL